jgi:hypothetical protein
MATPVENVLKEFCNIAKKRGHAALAKSSRGDQEASVESEDIGCTRTKVCLWIESNEDACVLLFNQDNLRWLVYEDPESLLRLIKTATGDVEERDVLTNDNPCSRGKETHISCPRHMIDELVCEMELLKKENTLLKAKVQSAVHLLTADAVEDEDQQTQQDNGLCSEVVKKSRTSSKRRRRM